MFLSYLTVVMPCSSRLYGKRLMRGQGDCRSCNVFSSILANMCSQSFEAKAMLGRPKARYTLQPHASLPRLRVAVQNRRSVASSKQLGPIETLPRSAEDGGTRLKERLTDRPTGAGFVSLS